MTWGAGGSVSDRSNTNSLWLKNSPLGKYLANSPTVYKCPEDNFLSVVQVAAGFKQRLRSTSMNSVFGRFSRFSNVTWNWALPQYAQYLKQASVPKPAKTWLMIDEHPDSINDGYFINRGYDWVWIDLPASYHNGAACFSFADGHSETHRWSLPSTKAPARPDGASLPFKLPRSEWKDYDWLLERTSVDRD